MMYYMYKITNLVNGKIYVGVHKTEDLEDGYMGSGSILLKAQKKYGLESFRKEILEFFSSLDEMFSREAEIVDMGFVLREDTYNLRVGGYGGFDYINEHVATLETRAKGGENCRLLEHGLFSAEGQRKHQEWAASEANKENLRKLSREIAQNSEIRERRKATFKKTCHAQGEKNSQFGSQWITDGASNRKIDKNSEIPEGWRRGRIIKGHGTA